MYVSPTSTYNTTYDCSQRIGRYSRQNYQSVYIILITLDTCCLRLSFHALFCSQVMVIRREVCMLAPVAVKYTSKIIKAGALLADTKMLLENWDLQLGVPANLQLMLRENLFGKASRSRVEDILAIFRQRYLTDPGVLNSLVALVRAGWSTRNLDPVLYYLSLRSDALLRDAVTGVLVPMLERGKHVVTVQDVVNWIKGQVSAGRTDGKWGDATILRTAQGVMSTLRDFGVLHGKMNKHIAPPYLPLEAFAFIAFLLNKHRPSGDRLVNDPEWQVFFLSPASVERFFLEAHQEHLLEFRSVARVVRVEFPATTIEEYTHALTSRTY
jgi:hypothetical protein